MRAIPGNRIVATRPLFSRWPEQSVLGQQTVVSGHLEFSLKTTATFWVPGKVPTTPLFSMWPEQSVLGQQTLVSGHLEFSLKTTALKPHARHTREQNCSYL